MTDADYPPQHEHRGSELSAVSLRLPLRDGAPTKAGGARARTAIPTRCWLFAGFAVLWAVFETVNLMATDPSSK
jgi:hypothetical protein